MQALLLEYDAADFRGRHDLLEREGATIRDVARWRREVARQVADGEIPLPTLPPTKTVPAVLDETAWAAVDSGDTPKDSSSKPEAESQPPAARPRATGPLSALRSDVVAAHASALVYHADSLSRLIADLPQPTGQRRRTSPIDRLTAAARETSAAAREVLSTRRRSGITDTPTRDSVNVSAELNDMLSQLSDYSSLAVAVQLLARELAPAAEHETGAVPRRAPSNDRARKPWWGGEDAESPEGEERRGPRTWGSRKQDE
jgi:hypothetical protein